MSNEELVQRLHAFAFEGDTDSVGVEFDGENWLLIHRQSGPGGVPAPGFWTLASVQGKEYSLPVGTVITCEEAGELLVSFRDRTEEWVGLSWQVPSAQA